MWFLLDQNRGKLCEISKNTVSVWVTVYLLIVKKIQSAYLFVNYTENMTMFKLVKNEILGLEGNEFLHGVQACHPEIDGAVLLLGRFEKAMYTDGLYQGLGITKPTSLNKAIDVRKADFLAGRAMLKAAQNLLGLTDAQIGIGENRAPIWPDDRRGSLSHTHGLVASFLTSRQDLSLGVDVETIATGNSAKAIKQQVLSHAERKMIDAADDWPLNMLTTLAFSAKETLFKALYPQVKSFFGFDAAELKETPGEGTITLRLRRSLSGGYLDGQVFELNYLTDPEFVMTWLAVPCQN